MSKSAKKRSSTSASPPVAAPNPTAQATADDSENNKPVAGSKQACVIAMLRSRTGATIAGMMAATGWQQHSVRGFLAGVVRKRLKLKLGSEKVDGQRVYRLANGPFAKSSPSRLRRKST